MKKILILAGEESGVIYAKEIAAKLALSVPGIEVRGYADYGFATHDLAVFGYWEVLRRIFFFLRVKRTMERAIDVWRPDVVCTIDYPGLNLKLAAYAKSRGIRAVHVVCPQVWAWRKGRIPNIEAGLDNLCCFLPFEPALFSPGFAEFVGHPLAEKMRGESELPREENLLAVLPGSRLGEIEHHMPTILEAIRTLRGEFPSVRVVIPAANARARSRLERFLSSADGDGEIELADGGAREILRRATAAIVASGTATFEAALAKCPMVVVYRVSALLGAFLRRAITGVKHVALANVIAEKAGVECPIPEFLQENLTAENLVGTIRPWLADAAARREASAKLESSLSLLRSDGNSMSRIAEVILRS